MMPYVKKTKKSKKRKLTIALHNNWREATMAPSCYDPTDNESQASIKVEGEKEERLDQPLKRRRSHFSLEDVQPASASPTSPPATNTPTTSTNGILASEHYKPIKKRKLVHNTVNEKDDIVEVAEIREVYAESEEDMNGNKRRLQEVFMPNVTQKGEHLNDDMAEPLPAGDALSDNYSEPQANDAEQLRNTVNEKDDIVEVAEIREVYAESEEDMNGNKRPNVTQKGEHLNDDMAEPLPAGDALSDNYSEPQANDAEQRTEYMEVDEPSALAVGSYVELRSTNAPMHIRSAADTEAALELLSLAASVPPLPPIYHPIKPQNIYIMTDTYHQSYQSTAIYQAIQSNITPLQQVSNQVEHTSTPYPVDTYVAYEQPEVVQPVYGTLSSPPLVLGESTSMFSEPLVLAEQPPFLSLQQPVNSEQSSNYVIVPAMQSIQVPVIEPVPETQHLSIQESDHLSIQESECCKEESSPIETLLGKYDCTECGKRYSTSSNLSRHKQTHRSLDSQAAKRCGECGKAYVSMPALAMHVLTHRMSHVCAVCGKQFSRPWLLRGHLRSHTGEKPYSCECCGKAFADRSNLRSHLQTHSSEKRWDCVRCNKTFALKSYLNKHQEAACIQD